MIISETLKYYNSIIDINVTEDIEDIMSIIEKTENKLIDMLKDNAEKESLSMISAYQSSIF